MVYADKVARGRMIADISATLIGDGMPPDVRDGALDLIGWLARRMPGEAMLVRAPEQIRLYGEGR